ncbi:MAG: hypothetical protein AB2A00_19895 [Myxococcota bacterium]
MVNRVHVPRRAFALPLCALVVLSLGACRIGAEDEPEETKRSRAAADAGGRNGFSRFDGGTLRPADPPDAALPDEDIDAGAPDASGGPGGPDAGNTNGLDAGVVDAAPPQGYDAGNNGVSTCNTWQDCPPHYGDLNSAFECVSNQCVCDPTGNWQYQCTNQGAYFSDFDCFCVMNGGAPPSEDPDPDDNCGWEYEYYCEPDRWVDDSHYERRCETVNGQTECRDVWVDDGHWEDGGCNHVRWVWKCR